MSTRFFLYTLLNVKTFYFKKYVLNNYSFVVFNPQIGPYQVRLLRACVDLGVMVMKGYNAFPKAPALLEPHH